MRLTNAFCWKKDTIQPSTLLPISFNHSKETFYTAEYNRGFGDFLLQHQPVKVELECLLRGKFGDDIVHPDFGMVIVEFLDRVAKRDDVHGIHEIRVDLLEIVTVFIASNVNDKVIKLEGIDWNVVVHVLLKDNDSAILFQEVNIGFGHILGNHNNKLVRGVGLIACWYDERANGVEFNYHGR